jgi:cyclophilin family peptidyl-prolyl cis-trans isomerase
MVQGGDIENGDGTGTLNIYGEESEDENLHWRDMDAKGLVCSANRGKNTNGCQYAHYTTSPQKRGQMLILWTGFSSRWSLVRI